MKNKIVYVLLGVTVAVSSSIVASTTSLPFHFSSGQAARASDVNSDFDTLVTAANGLDTRVATLENPNASLPVVAITQSPQATGTQVTAAGKSYTVTRVSLPALQSGTRAFVDFPVQSANGFSLFGDGLTFASHRNPKNTFLGGFQTTLSGFSFICLEDMGYNISVLGSGQTPGTSFNQSLQCSTNLDAQSPVFLAFSVSTSLTGTASSSASDFSNTDPYAVIPSAAQRAQNRTELRSLLQYVNISTGH